MGEHLGHDPIKVARGQNSIDHQASLRRIPENEKPWVCPAWHLDQRSLDKVMAWAESVEWPEGTELNDPEKLHVTAFYSRDGLRDAQFQEFIADNSDPAGAYSARVAAIERFDPGDRDDRAPIVLKLDAPELADRAQHLGLEAEAGYPGVEVVRHPDGYQPHITIAFGPTEGDLPEAPPIELSLGELGEIHLAKFRG